MRPSAWFEGPPSRLGGSGQGHSSGFFLKLVPYPCPCAAEKLGVLVPVTNPHDMGRTGLRSPWGRRRAPTFPQKVTPFLRVLPLIHSGAISSGPIGPAYAKKALAKMGTKPVGNTTRGARSASVGRGIVPEGHLIGAERAKVAAPSRASTSPYEAVKSLEPNRGYHQMVVRGLVL